MNILKGKINPDLLVFDLVKKDATEVIEYLAGLLYQGGFVKETYLEAILKREKEFPTGLFLTGYNIAIPHTETCEVNQAAIAVAVLKKPIIFRYMADPSQEVPVSLVFMLAIKDPKAQVPVLAQIMKIVGREEKLKALVNAEDQATFKDILEKEDEE